MIANVLLAIFASQGAVASRFAPRESVIFRLSRKIQTSANLRLRVPITLQSRNQRPQEHFVEAQLAGLGDLFHQC